MRLACVLVMLGCSRPSSAPNQTSTPSVQRAKPIFVPALQPPEGARLMIGLADGAITGRAAISPTGDVLAIAGEQNGVQLIQIATARGLAARLDLACMPQPRTLECRSEIAFSRDGRHVAVYWPQGDKLVQLAVPSARTEFETTAEEVSDLAFLDDGRLAAVGRKATFAFDATGKRSELFKGYGKRISPDGRQMLIEVDDESRIVEIASAAIVQPPKPIAIDDVAWSGDGKTWVASTRGEWRDVVMWRAGDRDVTMIASSEEARRIAGGNGLMGFAFPAPYDQVYVGMRSSLVGIGLDGKRKFESVWLKLLALEHGAIARGDDLVVQVGTCVLRLDPNGQPIAGPMLCPQRPAQLAFEGDQLHAVPWDGKIVLTFDTKTGALVGSKQRDRIPQMWGEPIVSGDGKLRVVPELDKVSVADVASGKQFELPCGPSSVGHVALSPDAKLLVCDTYEGVEVYELATKKRIKRIEHPNAERADTFAITNDRKLAISSEHVVIYDL